MSFLSKLLGRGEHYDKIVVDDATLIEAGACPNCWGVQEYDNQFIEYMKDQTKSNINHDKDNQKAFVQQFIETHVTGIMLKREGDYLQCPTCQSKYKYVSSKAV